MIVLLISASVSTVLSLFGTRYVIIFFRRLGRGQPILGKEGQLAVPEHQHKAGTPTMGGVAIVIAAITGYLVAHFHPGIVFSDQAIVVIIGVLALAAFGFVDDFIKVRKMRNRGIFWKRKGYLLFFVCLAIVWVLYEVAELPTTVSFTRFDWPGWHLPLALWLLWSTFIVFATSHAVNVTDGLDGLAAGSALFSFLGFTVFAFWGFRNPDFYNLVNPLDLACLSVAFAGACAGFLWWNAAPARVFMGDVGALALGGAMGLFALTTGTQLLLPILAGLNVIEIMSVAIQMGVYRASGRKKRVFKISPIHHHFELSGWPETTVIIRFWLISGIFTAVAVGIYIADFTRLASRLG